MSEAVNRAPFPNSDNVETNIALEKRQKKPRKPKSEENKPGRYDPRNRLNDLTGKEWLLLTASFWTTEPSPDDKVAYAHPAPFLVKDVEKLISMFTKRGMTVLDPFVGSGTTILAANRLGRPAIGIDINDEYREISEMRLSSREDKNFHYFVGDALDLLDQIGEVDYVVTSPPYHNILKNTTKGIRHKNGKQYRMGAREGMAFYSDHPNDLGNFDEYPEFINVLSRIMEKVFRCLREEKYCTLILSDFTVNKAEVCVQADIVKMMQQVGFEFCGTTVLLQPVKPLFPFGYPYRYKVNHHHQNMMTFMKATQRTTPKST
jgi:DNA modification methylase